MSETAARWGDTGPAETSPSTEPPWGDDTGPAETSPSTPPAAAPRSWAAAVAASPSSSPRRPAAPTVAQLLARAQSAAFSGDPALNAALRALARKIVWTANGPGGEEAPAALMQSACLAPAAYRFPCAQAAPLVQEAWSAHAQRSAAHGCSSYPGFKAALQAGGSLLSTVMTGPSEQRVQLNVRALLGQAAAVAAGSGDGGSSTAVQGPAPAPDAPACLRPQQQPQSPGGAGAAAESPAEVAAMLRRACDAAWPPHAGPEERFKNAAAEALLDSPQCSSICSLVASVAASVCGGSLRNLGANVTFKQLLVSDERFSVSHVGQGKESEPCASLSVERLLASVPGPGGGPPQQLSRAQAKALARHQQLALAGRKLTPGQLLAHVEQHAWGASSMPATVALQQLAAGLVRAGNRNKQEQEPAEAQEQMYAAMKAAAGQLAKRAWQAAAGSAQGPPPPYPGLASLLEGQAMFACVRDCTKSPAGEQQVRLRISLLRTEAATAIHSSSSGGGSGGGGGAAAAPASGLTEAVAEAAPEHAADAERAAAQRRRQGDEDSEDLAETLWLLMHGDGQQKQEQQQQEQEQEQEQEQQEQEQQDEQQLQWRQQVPSNAWRVAFGALRTAALALSQSVA